MKRLLLIWTFVTGATLLAGAQPNPQRRIDSLEAVLRVRPQADTNRVKMLNELASEVRQSNPARAEAATKEGLALAEKLQFPRGKADLQYQAGVLSAMRGDLDQALTYFTASRDTWQQLHNEVEVGAAIGSMANILVQQGQYPEATVYYLRSLRIAEKHKDTDGRARALLNLGNVYTRTNNFNKAITYFEQSLKLISPQSDPGMYAGGLRNIGQSYLNLNQPAQGVPYLQRALTMARSSGDKPNETALLYTLGRMDGEAGRLVPATTQLLAAKAIAEEIGDQLTLSRCLAMLGDVARQQRQPAQAIAYYQQALTIAREAGSNEDLMQMHSGLAAAYSSAGNFEKAFESQKLFSQFSDSLFSENTTQQVTELQTKYETEKKEAQNRLQAAQLRTQQQIIRRRNVQLVAGLLIAGLLAGLGYLLYTRRRLRREVEFAQERQQLERLRSQAVLEAEEAERRRIGSDLHDGVGQLLTAAKLNLHALGEQLSVQTEGQQTMLQNALDVVDESFREVRSISHNLMPNSLIKRGLAQAVRDFLGKISPDDRLQIQLEVVGLDRGRRLDATVENVLFRVIQELAQNIIKHARATQMTLQIIRREEELTVMVEDNGVGFDPAALGAEAGIGLKNIESRMAYLGGRAEFDSQPSRGTTVTLEVPLTAPAGAN
jgi:two-component system NarL family sensor kinase